MSDLPAGIRGASPEARKANLPFAKSGKKAGFERVNISTEFPGVDFNAAGSV
jgi:hypothetical protein